MLRRLCGVLLCVMPVASHADVVTLDAAVSAVRQNCAAIADAAYEMRQMAGINTAVTGVGTLGAGSAAVVGFVKQNTDAQADAIVADLNNIDNMTDEQFFALLGQMANYAEQHGKLAELTQKSKRLGNWRTGLMAGAAATNVAGAVIADTNRVTDTLRAQINACTSAVADLRAARIQAHLNRVSPDRLAYADGIIEKCGQFDYLNTKDIDNRADGAMWSAAVGATTGVVGTITSAIANTNKTRANDTVDGVARERNLNTASNILAVGTTLAGATATAFNATQIGAIKKLSQIADECVQALQ